MRQQRRLDRLQRTFRSIPIAPQTIRDACERFRRTGELPEDVRVARHVLDWCDTGINAAEFSRDARDVGALMRAAVNTMGRRHDPVMQALRNEAVFAWEPVRDIARQMLKRMAEGGGDPSEPMFKMCGYEVPEMTCSSMALTLLGFPECLATKDNAERADAVFVKLRDLRARVKGEGADWFARFDKAVAEHRASGVLPQDALLAEAVVADAEFLEVLREKVG